MRPRKPPRLRPDVGSVGIEYVGVAVALLTLVGALATATEPGQELTKSVGYNICKASSPVTGAACERPGGGSGSKDGPDEPEAKKPNLRPGDAGYNGMTPQEQAEVKDFVSIGDSYSSGEGEGPYIDDTDDNRSWGFWADDYENMCHRSVNAYSMTVAESFAFKGEYELGACSGAVVEDYYSPVGERADERDGQPAQRDYVKQKDPSLVTMSMGGNDFGFSTVVEKCVFRISDCYEDPAELKKVKDDIYKRTWGVEWDPDPAVRAARERDSVSNPPKGSLLELYASLRTDAGPDARILIVGYPRLFPEDKEPEVPWILVDRGERNRINDMGAFANSEMKRAVEASSGALEYVDVTDAFAGHELTTADPWINDINPGRGTGKGISQESYHPNAEGNRAIAEKVNEAIRRGRQ